jgi:NADH-quinone oxidoreductase subunit N
LGFFFKLTVAPFHIWAVDVYEGSPTVISFFFAVVPKISFIVVLVRLVFYSFYSWILVWSNFFIFVSFCCIVFGAFGAMAQRKLKRFLVYSSVSHLGYIILAFSSGSFFGVSSIFFYLFIYIVMSFSVWSVFFYFFTNSKRIS